MDFAAIMSLLPQILSGISLAQTVASDLKTGSWVATVQKDLPDVFNLFTQVGQTLFPNLPTTQQTQAGATVLDVATVEKIQTELNQLKVVSPALDVDGHYGPLTKSAVTMFQSSKGLTADQWAGPLTQSALDAAVAALPAVPTTAPSTK